MDNYLPVFMNKPEASERWMALSVSLVLLELVRLPLLVSEESLALNRAVTFEASDIS